MKRRNRISKAIWTAVISLISVIMLLPLVWMVSASLKTPTKVFTSPIEWIPKIPQWDNYAVVWSEGAVPFRVYFFNSVLITVLSLTGSLVVCSMAAYAFSKIRFPGRDMIFMCYLATMMIPNQVTLIPRFMIMNWLHLNDTHAALILPSVFNIIAMFTLRQFFNTIPNDLLESARIDGAGHLRIYLRIVLPMAGPALISAGILAFVRSWNDYMNPLIFINTLSRYTVTLAIKNYLNVDGQPRYDLAMVASVISLLPIMALFLSVQRYYFEGVATSGMKE